MPVKICKDVSGNPTASEVKDVKICVDGIWKSVYGSNKVTFQYITARGTAPVSQTTSFKNVITLPSSCGSSTGYTFGGWSCGGITYTPGQQVIAYQSMIFSAVWEIQKFNVYLYNNGSLYSTLTADYGSSITLPSGLNASTNVTTYQDSTSGSIETANIINATHIGWDTKAIQKYNVINNIGFTSPVITSNVTFYALYSSINYNASGELYIAPGKVSEIGNSNCMNQIYFGPNSNVTINQYVYPLTYGGHNVLLNQSGDPGNVSQFNCWFNNTNESYSPCPFFYSLYCQLYGWDYGVTTTYKQFGCKYTYTSTTPIYFT